MKILSRTSLAVVIAGMLLSSMPATAVAQSSFSGSSRQNQQHHLSETPQSPISDNEADTSHIGDGPFAQWDIPTPPGAEWYEVNQATEDELNPQGLAEWHPTSDPKNKLVPGQMRSDMEDIPAGVSKVEADQAEIREAQLASPTAPTLNARQGCGVYWPTSFEVCGLIKEKYDSIGGPTSFLLLPKSNELTNPDGIGKRSEFVNGFIYWRPETGAHTVSIPVSKVWERHGWEGGFLGYPITSDIAQGNAWYRQDFQGGHVYTHNALPASQASIQGAIFDKWQSMGAQTGELGYPVSDELTTPDGVGRYNVFENGMIYWTPQTGAHAVQGAILSEWGKNGYEKSNFGFPTSDEYLDSESDITQEFSGGTLRVRDFVKGDEGTTFSNGKLVDNTLIKFIRDAYGVDLLREIQLDLPVVQSGHQAYPPENGTVVATDSSGKPYTFQIKSPISISSKYVYAPNGVNPALHDYCTAPSPQFWFDDKTKIAADLRGPCSYHDLCYGLNPDNYTARSNLCDPALRRDWQYVCRESYNSSFTRCRGFVDSAYTVMHSYQRVKNMNR